MKPSGKLKPGQPGLFRAFRRKIGFSGILEDTLSNVIAGLLVVLFGGIVLSNSTFQLSFFTGVRNGFVSPQACFDRLASIRGVALDDETMLIQNEDRHKGGVYDALAEAIRVINEYASTAVGRKVIIGVDYVLNRLGNEDELETLLAVLSNLGPNVYVVLGAALNQAGTDTGYFRYDIYRDSLLAKVVKAKGNDYVKEKIFSGNLHLLKGKAVSGFQELENTDIALGYVPVFYQAPVPYYSLPFMMYLLGEIIPTEALAEGLFYISQDGYLGYDCDADTWLKPALGKTQADFSNVSIRYNFFSAADISNHPLYRFNYFPLGRLSETYDTSGQAVMTLNESINSRTAALGAQGVTVKSRAGADYFIIFRTMSLGYVGDDASTDVVVTPASTRDPFTNTLNTVSGAMTHMVALSNLINHEYITEAPWWMEVALAIVLALLCLWIGLRLEFRTIVLACVGIFAGILFFGYALFLMNVFFVCRLPLIVSFCILSVLITGRFLKSVEGKE